MKKIIFLILFFILVGFVFFLWQGIYLPKDIDSVDEQLFSVEKGQGLFQIAENLEKDGLIKNKYFFVFYVSAKRAQKRLQAGKYSLNSSMNIPEIAKKIISGDTTKIVVTIPEGYNIAQIDARLAEAGLIEKGEFINFDIENFQFSNLEGFLFPDTYQFFYGTSIEEIVRKMLDNFEKKLNSDLREEIERQEKTIFEIITMASLIEKEVYNTPECPNCKNLVSGILWKRLEKGMPLQVDATISYITGKRTIKITKEEIQIDSPYNTYKYLGLPIGPICNPGLESILATLYPKSSEYWYYLSTPESETIFSKTLEEHNIAKAKYLK